MVHTSNRKIVNLFLCLPLQTQNQVLPFTANLAPHPNTGAATWWIEWHHRSTIAYLFTLCPRWKGATLFFVL